MLLYNIGKTTVMLAAGSSIGLLYVLLLPFVWILAAAIIMKRTVEVLGSAAAKSTAFGWRPIEAYLTGKKKQKKSDKEK